MTRQTDIMMRSAETFHVALVRGKAVVIPCKYEYCRRMGYAKPRLLLRNVILFSVREELANGFALGVNYAKENSK